MTNRDRFLAVMNFQPVDRLPVIEMFHWWDKTIDRWHGEGLPADLTEHGEIGKYLGLDLHRYTWLTPRYRLDRPEGRPRELGWVASADEYDRLRPRMFDLSIMDLGPVEPLADLQRRGDTFLWLQVDGCFWFQREMLGIESHLYAFHDQPDLLRRICDDLAAFTLALISAVCEIAVPDVIVFSEDLSYNHGPMLSKACFDAFTAPFYEAVLPLLGQHGIVPFVDTDGNVHELIDWFESLGVGGLLPLERMAGNDVPALRRRHPRMRFMGGFDKTVMHLGEAAIRAEFERLLPVMRSGGYVPSCDHQTPPGVSLDDYRLYARLLREYCEEAGRHGVRNPKGS